MARKLVVEIVGDTSALEKSYRRAEKSTTSFGKSLNQATRGGLAATVSFKGLGRSLAFASGTFLGASGFVAVTEQAIDAASDLNEQLSKTRVVFGRSSRGVVAWSKTTSSAFGISRRAALGTASSFGALFRPLGITGKVAAQQSRALTELGADLASFYNTDVASALDAIRSGLVGESEPLRQYGVLLSETRVQAQAMADTGKRSAASLTNQEKALARIKIIFTDTAIAQGDFARTSEGLANQSRTLSANLDDLETKIGGVLVPTLTVGTGAVNDFLESFSTAGTAENDFVRAMGAIGNAADFAIGKLRLVKGLQGALASIPGVGQIYTAAKAYKAVRDLFGPDDPGGARAGPLGGAVQEANIKAARGEALRLDALDKTATKQLDPKEAARRRALRNEWFDNLVGRREDRVQDIKPLQGQLAELRSIAALITERIKTTKDATRRLGLEDELLNVQRQEQDVLDQMHENTRTIIAERKALEDQRKEREKARRAAAILARDNRQFLALGLGPGGSELVPKLPNLKKRLAGLRKAVEGTALDTRGTQAMFARIAKVLAAGPDKVSTDVRAAIDKMFDDIAAKLKEGTTGIRAVGFRKIGVNKFVESLGLTLSPADKLRLQQGLAMTGSGLSVPGARSAQFAGGGGVTINGGLNLYGVQNMRELESEIARRSKSRPQPRRGSR